MDATTNTRVELVSTSDPHTNLKAGDKGVVRLVDDVGTVHVNWENGSTLGLVPGEDHWVERRRYLKVVYDVSELTDAELGCLTIEAVVQAESSDGSGDPDSPGHPGVEVETYTFDDEVSR